MTRSLRRTVFVGASLVVATTIATKASMLSPQATGVSAGVASGQAAASAGVAHLTDEELEKRGEEAIKKICVECHPFDDIVVTRRTPKEWKDVTAQMANKGAIATADQFAVIRQYLMRYYGVLHVNTAEASDLSLVLGLSASQADAVVEYRKAHGNFADLAGLLSVPGLDRAKVEADPDALKFN